MKINKSGHTFDGRIPKYTNITKITKTRAEVYLLNYGGSNINFGTHIAFFGNSLEKIKTHMKLLLEQIYQEIPYASAIEHKASIIRPHQALLRDGKMKLELKKIIRNLLDPNKVIYTTAMRELDEY